MYFSTHSSSSFIFEFHKSSYYFLFVYIFFILNCKHILYLVSIFNIRENWYLVEKECELLLTTSILQLIIDDYIAYLFDDCSIERAHSYLRYILCDCAICIVMLLFNNFWILSLNNFWTSSICLYLCFFYRRLNVINVEIVNRLTSSFIFYRCNFQCLFVN